MTELNVSNTQIERIKNVGLSILDAFIEVCKKLDLRYYVVGGTLLGAVRHKGFIPWDDDIDVGMPREDYMTFLKYGQRYLPDYYFLQSYKSDKNWLRHFCKIRDSRTTFIETPTKDWKINHGVYIDVFPMNHTERKKAGFYYGLLGLIESGIFKDKTPIVKLKTLIAKILTLKFTARSAFLKRERLLNRKKTGDFFAFSSALYEEKDFFPKDWFRNGETLDFEGIKVIAPCKYDQFLRQVYGDYMTLPPEEKRTTHHYTEIIDLDKSYSEYI